MSNKPLVIDYFSDVLCVWAYAAQKRNDEIQSHFGHKIRFEQHFISIFGAVEQKMALGWKEEGAAGYHRHVLKSVKKFDYLAIHPDVWLGECPKSSLNTHIFLKAAQLLVKTGELSLSAFEQLIWQIRLAFFKELRNIGQHSVLCEIARSQGVALDALLQHLETGAAHAALEEDRLLVQEHQITGSPTYLFNEGRQRLYGNVGYRIIEANLQELLEGSQRHEASWC